MAVVVALNNGQSLRDELIASASKGEGFFKARVYGQDTEAWVRISSVVVILDG